MLSPKWFRRAAPMLAISACLVTTSGGTPPPVTAPSTQMVAAEPNPSSQPSAIERELAARISKLELENGHLKFELEMAQLDVKVVQSQLKRLQISNPQPTVPSGWV